MSTHIPSFEDWLSGQCHRQDLVGALARLRVSQSEDVRASGFDAWIIALHDGKVMAASLADSQTEYAKCVTELTATGHSESFPAILGADLSDEQRRAAWTKHKAEPWKSTWTHLHDIHKALRRRLDQSTLIYLDTCHWINLRKVILNTPDLDARYVPLLARLRQLRTANTILCPFSYPVYHELTKQSDPITRRAMATLIDDLSESVCIQPPNQVERIELKRQILKSVLGPTAPDVGEWIWTKAQWVCGEMIPVPKAG